MIENSFCLYGVVCVCVCLFDVCENYIHPTLNIEKKIQNQISFNNNIISTIQNFLIINKFMILICIHFCVVLIETKQNKKIQLQIAHNSSVKFCLFVFTFSPQSDSIYILLAISSSCYCCCCCYCSQSH